MAEADSISSVFELSWRFYSLLPLTKVFARSNGGEGGKVVEGGDKVKSERK